MLNRGKMSAGRVLGEDGDEVATAREGEKLKR